MEQSINLSDNEIEIIEKQLAGVFNPFLATAEEKDIYMGVIDKAEALCDELDAYDEASDDLLAWFYEKCKK